MKHTDKWDRRFLDLAEYISRWSKDPSTKIGAVIVRPDKTIASVGYNGFPRGVADADYRLKDRELKYKLVVHAEVNAVLNAPGDLLGCTLYCWPMMQPYAPTCNECAKVVIQSGIRRVVGGPVLAEHAAEDRWGDPCRIARDMYLEAGVIVDMF